MIHFEDYVIVAACPREINARIGKIAYLRV